MLLVKDFLKEKNYKEVSFIDNTMCDRNEKIQTLTINQNQLKSFIQAAETGQKNNTRCRVPEVMAYSSAGIILIGFALGNVAPTAGFAMMGAGAALLVLSVIAWTVIKSCNQSDPSPQAAQLSVMNQSQSQKQQEGNNHALRTGTS